MDNKKDLYEVTNPNADLEFEQNVMNNPEALNQYKNDLNTYIDNEVQRINNGYIPRYAINSYRIVPFSFKGFNFRSIIFDNDPNGNVWFVNKEICDYLDLANPSQVIRDANLLEFERMTLRNTESHSGQRGGAQSMTIISESGLYKLIGNSRKPEAREFQDWIYGNVIPSIRRTGAYIGPDLQQRLMNDPSYIRTIIAQNNELMNTNKALTNRIAEDSKYTELGKACYNNTGNITINELSKIIQNVLNFPFGEHELRSQLRSDGFLMKADPYRKNPTDKSIDMGLMQLVYPGVSANRYDVAVTPKGVQFFIKYFIDKYFGPTNS